MAYFISHSIHIKNHQIYVDGLLQFQAEQSLTLKQFLKESYNKLQIDYPKFHKMDSLCKLGSLGAELLNRKRPFQKETALVFSNSASSLDTDRSHQRNLKNIASPATFVYTLPNIVLGEISIKHGLQSENAFFVSETFNAALMYQYTYSLVDSTKISEALLGWIDVDEGFYNAFLCVISPHGEKKFSADNLQHAFDRL